MKSLFKKAAVVIASGCVMFSTIAAHADFVDMPEDPALRTALENAVANGLLRGKSDTEVAPYDAISRAEMGTIIVRTFGAEKEADISEFTDVPADEWYYEYMSKAVAMGAFAGSGDGKLNPEDNITKEEAFIVMSRIFGIQDFDVNDLAAYTDRDAIDDWAADYVAKIVSNGYWAKGGALAPTADMSRAEFAVLVDNMVDRYIDEAGEYSDVGDENIVIRTGNVTIKGMVNTGDVLVGDGVGADEITFSDCELHRLVARGGIINMPGSKLEFGRLEMSGVVLNCQDMKDRANSRIWGAKGTRVDLGIANITQ